MAVRNPEETNALSSAGALTARDLYTIWNGSSTKNLDASVILGRRALALQEYLLVSDIHDQTMAAWRSEDDAIRQKTFRQRADLISYGAEAKARLGFAQAARNLLEPLISGRDLETGERSRFVLQAGDIVREQSHQASNPATRDVLAADALELYRQAVILDPESLEARLAQAAMLFVTSGSHASRLEEARSLAAEILAALEKMENNNGPSFTAYRLRAIALIVLGRPDEALAGYARLKTAPGATTARLAEARHESRLLAEALGCPRRFFYPAFPPLQLLVFSGPAPSHFLPGALPHLRVALRDKLETLEARAGLVSANAGADLLFIEALGERPDAQCHVVLPWSPEEFYRAGILPHEQPGTPPVWEPLYRKALAEAATVRELAQLYQPQDDIGWRFTQEVMAGLALLTARASRLDVQPLVLWDGRPEAKPGGAKSFLELWRRLDREPEMISIEPVPAVFHAGNQPEPVRTERSSMRQEVKSMLFADIVGYSRLTENVIADFIAVFLQKVSVLLATSAHAPCCVNNWGDAVYAVFDFSHDAGLFALELTRMVNDGAEEWRKRGLCHREYDDENETWVERPLTLRVGLHTGPVLSHYNPVLRQMSYTGSQVSRAARIEPIAPPGEVYVSEEFAALAELGRGRPMAGGPQVEGMVCEYVGSRALSKNYPGLFRIYRLVPDRDFAIEELARAAHLLYCERQAAQGKDSRDHPALRPWEKLEEDLRDANRAQVTDIPNKLHALGYELSAGSGLAPSELIITAAQMETLSRREHDRWMNERQRGGWTFGTERDDAARVHPCLVPWESLSEVEKQKDRDTVGNLPALIAKANFKIKKTSGSMPAL